MFDPVFQSLSLDFEASNSFALDFPDNLNYVVGLAFYAIDKGAICEWCVGAIHNCRRFALVETQRTGRAENVDLPK